MQVISQLNNLRISPRKVRLVARVIKGLDAIAAKYQLDYIIKRSSKPISRLLDSALANAHNNFGLARENLFIKDIVVNEGPKLKRFRPKGFGMTSPLEKKTSKIKIILDEKIPGLKAKPMSKKEVPAEAMEPAIEVKSEQMVKTQADKKPEIRKEIGKKGGTLGRIGGLGKKFFRRKAI
ncbi:MAG: 50S ribosomal protein L22 [Candidatus Yanofskybacteria bacterium RIFCSPHIGHO2_01_FULL_44_17]|uniref:Large ribosomal subunit protein uL22 n=1 Tax=Candidatus Yanofskybacteria bacterium RIFCSPHIGHO2_01_FULL_44_17 TaxID=1802668 RepID=A0A1F8ESN9_9BACT|nr:MAG: 50S ribosomal protein L22 [Candidatus Yanofskybacteria bacterium RIFCSPHIGHO2_01_FULL_44_17]